MFIVIGNTCWGRGPTEEAATAQARKVGGAKLIAKRLVYETPDDKAYITEMGDIVWHPAAGTRPPEADDPNRPRLVRKIDGRMIETFTKGQTNEHQNAKAR